MVKNTGASLEKEVYELISEMVKKNEFMVSYPNVRIRRRPRYYSKDRESEIEFDISVEKYLGNPDENENMRPSIIVIIECKDYSNSIPVDDVEEFHAKLQQIGADNTKGIMITQNGAFQRSALVYAESKGIALAKILPFEQVNYMLSCEICINPMRFETEMTEEKREQMEEKKRQKKESRIVPLIEKDYISYNRNFFSLTEDYSLEELLFRLLGKEDILK